MPKPDPIHMRIDATRALWDMDVFDALVLARGWLAVSIASASDDDRPALNKTICVELFPGGARLVATDSYILLAAWVPNLEHPDEPEPEPDESPFATGVAIDPHGRAKSFFTHLLKLAVEADDDGQPKIEATMQLGVLDGEPDGGKFEGMEATYVVIEHPDHERLKLEAYEGRFPSWQKILGDFKPKKTDLLAVNPELIVRLAKAAKIQAKLLGWRFGGSDAMALVEIIDSYPRTYGAAMPVRWDFDSNAPWAAETTVDGDGDPF